MLKLLPLTLALALPSQAALRFGCSTLSVQRIDPLVQPGALPSSHLHQIVGGNAFKPNMSGDLSEQATCTTCTFSEDFSNYWTAVLFFKHSNGSYKRVPLVPNLGTTTGTQGGMTVYYTQTTLGDDKYKGTPKMTIFKPGFRMTVGNPATNVLDGSKGQNGLRFVCLDSTSSRFPELTEIPSKPCKLGIMTIHHFPACWDGKNLDSPDHQSHMFHTQGTAFAEAGACPDSHPVRVPQIAYETLWDTSKFTSMWPTDGSNPLVFSYGGDSRGYGTHGDYVFGWKGDSLQRAMDSSCNFQACEGGKPLKSQVAAAMNKCTVPDYVKEDVDGWLPSLPGGIHA